MISTIAVPEPCQVEGRSTELGGVDSIRRAILLMWATLAAACLLSFPEIGSAQLPPRECLNRGCPDHSPNNGELVGTYGIGENQRHVPFIAFPQSNEVPFGGTFRFYYGVKRKSAGGPLGAIAVLVVKMFRQPQHGNQWLDRTMLYRNKFDKPSQKDGFEHWIDRLRYNRWHAGENIISDRLKSKFHIEFRANEHTSKPLSRRRSFVFEPIGDHHHDAELQKAYILGYKAVRPDGTWIDFNINFDKPFSEVYITIVDLGVAVVGDPVQWSWRFENSAR